MALWIVRNWLNLQNQLRIDLRVYKQNIAIKKQSIKRYYSIQSIDIHIKTITITMQAADSKNPGMSDKEILLVKKTYRQVTQNFYESPNQFYAMIIVNFNALMCETIGDKVSLDRLGLLSTLQILKIKSKPSPKLSQSVLRTIQHFKSPKPLSLQFSTLIQCFRQQQLFPVACMFSYLHYEKIIRSPNVEWKEVILEIGRQPALVTDICLELLNKLCKDNEGNAKQVVKSGFVKYIVSCYLEQKLSQKYLLYKALKFLKFISHADRTLIRDRQSSISKVIFTYDEYIPVIEELCVKCYDQEYAQSIYLKNKYDSVQEVDLWYVWSFCEAFAKNVNKNKLQELEKVLRKGNLSPEIQTKLYAVLNNLVRFQQQNIPSILQIQPKSVQSIFNYLKLISTIVKNDSSSFQLLNIQKLQKLVNEDKNPKSSVMLKYIQSLQSDNKSKVSTINPKLLEMFNLDKNADILMEGARKVPSNNEDLKVIRQILKKRQAHSQFQTDLLTTVKGKALESLSTALIDRKKLDLNSLLQQIDLNNIHVLAKLLKLIEVCLMMGHYQVDDFDKERIFEIISWIENNYKGELIDWGSISQVIMIFEGQDLWKDRLTEVPGKCFYLLGCIQVQQQNLQVLFKKLLNIFKSADNSSYKLSLIIGFLGRVFTREQKLKAIQRLSEYFKAIQSMVKTEQNWRTSLYMLALFINKWHDKQAPQQNKLFESLIQPIHTFVMKNFKSSEHQYKFLEACLPYKVPVEKLVDNIDFLLSQYGNLASYIFQNSNPKPAINYDKISTLSSAPHSASQSILQVLKFLKQNESMIQGQQITKLLKKVIQNQQKYWQLYPNFVTIINSILEIVAKTDNSSITKNLTDILVDILNYIDTNTQITPEQVDEILQEYLATLKALSQKGTHIDIQRLKRLSNKVQNQQIQTDIKEVLSNYKIIQKPIEPQKTNKSTRNVKIQPKTYQNSSQYIDNKIGSQSKVEIPKFTETKNIKKPVTKEGKLQNASPDRNYMTALQGTEVQTQQQEEDDQKDFDKEKQHLWMDDKQKDKVAEQIKQLDFSESQILSQKMTVTQALKKIKAMTERKLPTTEFPKCVSIIQENSLQPKQRDILGHLLVLFYNIEQHPDVLQLLLDKEKTNLSKEACYQIVSKHVEAFVLSDRWKFIGREWMDCAIKRISEGSFSDACQVVEYNLINVEDLEYFFEKKYYQQVVKNIYKVEDDDDAIFFLLLVGTSARLGDIKRYYIAQKLQLSILTYIDRWPDNFRITSNTFYALSSLVYSQPEICLQIAKKQQQMRKLFQSFRENYQSKAVVQSGGCFIANMAYSNDQVKQVLRKYDIIEKLVYVFQKNLQDPEISTFKQLLRSFGNLSLSEKCAKQIIDLGFCQLQVKMIEIFNMFINLDDSKMKLLKIVIDVFANLCSHKYNLLAMHKQRVTSTMIMLLETMDLNPPLIMGCIDTVDGLCQNAQIQAFAVKEKKLSYILIDILKIQQDEKIIVKATRLLTNLTINAINIPNILQANLLSVLANIVMPSFFMKYNQSTELNYLSNNPTVSTPPNKKMELYINKILVRIHNSKPTLELLLKSGYLDCLVRTIETADNLQDVYIDILGSYARGLPNFLNKRAFMCLIRVLTRKLKSKSTIQKCLGIFKTLLLRSYDRDEEDVVLTDTPMMYEIMLQQYKKDTLYLLGMHCSISKKLRKLLIAQEKKYNIIQTIFELTQVPQYEELANSVMFTIFNREQSSKQQKQQKQVKQPSQQPQTQQKALKILSQGFICELYRIDGTSKKAKIMLHGDSIVAFKYPDGEMKKKYTINLKNLRDFQFDYQKGSRQWKVSLFNKSKGMFSSQTPAEKCATMIGGTTWGQIAYINVGFVSREQKERFNRCLSVLILSGH